MAVLIMVRSEESMVIQMDRSPERWSRLDRSPKQCLSGKGSEAEMVVVSGLQRSSSMVRLALLLQRFSGMEVVIVDTK